jgi:hypothetical protein
MLESPQLHKMAFPTPMVRPLDESQGPSPLQGHGSWLMCEVPLNHLMGPHSIDVGSQAEQTVRSQWINLGLGC